ncbi:hypothetical protein [Blastopirellula marina]|uniref:hypothetical protein n=1 Tax=Blastopirellula marina TaxID=124 RepID=UPI0011B060CF|nr:hypothetical protein [Blastopirellula marina]
MPRLWIDNVNACPAPVQIRELLSQRTFNVSASGLSFRESGKKALRRTGTKLPTRPIGALVAIDRVAGIFHLPDLLRHQEAGYCVMNCLNFRAINDCAGRDDEDSVIETRHMLDVALQARDDLIDLQLKSTATKFLIEVAYRIKSKDRITTVDIDALPLSQLTNLLEIVQGQIDIVDDRCPIRAKSNRERRKNF